MQHLPLAAPAPQLLGAFRALTVKSPETRRTCPGRRYAAPTPVHVPATAAAPAGAPRPNGGNRRNLPTPASTGLPARTILVAKRLTNR